MQRAQGKPAAGRTRSLVRQWKTHTSSRHRRYNRSDPAIHARWFTAYRALYPAAHDLLVTVALWD
jgi:hypothetical protein